MEVGWMLTRALVGLGALLLLSQATTGSAQPRKPNILVIWGDDIGIHNISAYNLGLMGYKTPNIDRLAREGALFTDAYSQQSCTAGRASFILGQHPFRTGLLTIGMPGSPQGIPDWSPTIADLLKQQGYVTGQFGKNHLGDRDEHLPTVHGFDEFLGNLYHLNAEEEPEKLLLSEGSGVQEEVRSAGRAAYLGGWQGRAEDPGHRRPHPRAHAYRRSGDPCRRGEVRGDGGQGRKALLRLVQHDPHARVDTPREVRRGPDRHRPLPRRHGRARRHGGRGAQAARRPRGRQ